jgi:ABC-2 type transport system permease protein
VTSLILTRNILLRIAGDVRTLALIILLPLFFILLYGNSFSGSYAGLPVAIVNQDNGLASVPTEELGRITLAVDLGTAFVDALDREVLQVTLYDDAENALASVGDSLRAAVVLPKSFSNTVVTEAIRAGGARRIELEGTSVTLLPAEASPGPPATLSIDDSNPLLAEKLFTALNDAFAAVLETQQSSLTASAIVDLRRLHDGRIRMLDFTAPGIIGFAMTLITVMLTALSVVRERTGGTLTRILIAPVSAWQITLGYTLAFSAIAVFQTAELFVASTLLFDIRFIGHPGVVALVIILFAIGLQGIGTLISILSRNEAQAMQFVLFLLIPSIMLSGVFWPQETMPSAIRSLSYAIPLTYANSALRKVMLVGAGFGELVIELAALGGIALLAALLSVLSMRRQAHRA